MRFYSYDRFNKTYGYIPLLTEFSSIVPFPESLLNSLNTQIILGKQYVIEYKKDGSIISFKENSDHFLLSVLSVSDKTDEAAEWTGAVPVREENDVFYDENDDIISTQVMQDFFTYQMEKLYPFKFNCLGSLSKSGLIEGTSIPELYYYRFRLNYLISSSEGLLTSIDNLAPGSNIYISHLPNGVPCGYTFNPYEENFSTNILNVDNYNISDLATLGGGIINV